ncbi:hypothetical protein [Reichenbachiella sp. MSK19-1]|uniref:GumK N-terminal domain-containing glycosyltransferase n=1 Tax=Reichenbachiella sp. MSK19-1 TaxID=1897631 RepID=UPI000E6C012A|nr:hypothetical protein [Reichenbachiella sp. MSK19-1]RJE71716.1 hypothetical protein BGP76_06410 [Reichenbachiella sp. MSK19-1]
MKVLLISKHIANSKRKAGFHHLADAFYRLGHDVTFVTSPLSLLDFVKRDYRFRTLEIGTLRKILYCENSYSSYVYFTLFHPFNSSFWLVNLALKFIVNQYRLIRSSSFISLIRVAEVVVVESTAAILLVKEIKRLNPLCKVIYKASDDIVFHDLHPSILKAETELGNYISFASVPTGSMYKRFTSFLNKGSLYFDKHAINKDLYTKEYSSPYIGNNNAIFIGTWLFDKDCIEILAKHSPDWRFYLIGPLEQCISLPNVIFIGELKFEETIAYIKYANIGLHTIPYMGKGVESLKDSLKSMQYSYFQIPTLAPDFLATDRLNIKYYTPNDESSITSSFEMLISMNKKDLPKIEMKDWVEVAKEFLDR